MENKLHPTPLTRHLSCLTACILLVGGLAPLNFASAADGGSQVEDNSDTVKSYAVPKKRGIRRSRAQSRPSLRHNVKPPAAAAPAVATPKPTQQPQTEPSQVQRQVPKQAPSAAAAIDSIAVEPAPASTRPPPTQATAPDGTPLAKTYPMDIDQVPASLPEPAPAPHYGAAQQRATSKPVSTPPPPVYMTPAEFQPATPRAVKAPVVETPISKASPKEANRARPGKQPNKQLGKNPTSQPNLASKKEQPIAEVMAGKQAVELAPELQPVCAPRRNANDDPRNRRPGRRGPVIRYQAPDCDPDRLALPNPKRLNDFAAVPDRWRIVGSLGYEENLLDPYSGFNVLKGDMPVHGEWFVSLLAVLDSIYEPRSFPVPVGNSTTQRSGSQDLIGDGDQTVVASNLITEFVYYRGDTVFRPPDWEFRFTPVFNINQVTFDEKGLADAEPDVGQVRRDTHIGIQSAFVDYHIRNVSTRYDFDSIRVGIQPYNHDFRGFLFLDQPFGVRLFGTRSNNIFQYNLAWFRRLEKDTNSGLNDISKSWREDDVFIANIFWQDLFKLGFTSQFSLLYNRNRERDDILFDRNDFIARPASLGTERARDYDVTYLGYSGDGHFGRLNLSISAYSALGRESNGTFNNEKSNIRAWFAAFEAGWDQDWVRYRFSFLYGSGDKDPFDDKAEGFDAVFENPIFAGADTSYWIRQTVPLIGGGRVTLSGRNGVLNSLRSSKEQGQSNFVNPGIILAGLGTDLDLSTTTRLSFNLNQLWFDDSTVIEVARNQGNIDEEIGLDASAALIWRPLATQNIIFRLSGAILFPGEGFKQLFGDEDHYSILANLLLVY